MSPNELNKKNDYDILEKNYLKKKKQYSSFSAN